MKIVEKVKVLLIEDSGFMRIVLSDIIRKSNVLELVGSAKNGLIGVEIAEKVLPDVILTDMIMPDYDGLYVVKKVKEQGLDIPIILLSALEKASPKIFEALNEGAFDFMDKPTEDQIEKGYPELIQFIKEAAESNFSIEQRELKKQNTFDHSFSDELNYKILVIGASTGGPGAVEYLLNNLPDNLAIPVLIIQHMPQRFIETFTERLKLSTGKKVIAAKEGTVIKPNYIYLAPTDFNSKLMNKNGETEIVKDNRVFAAYNNPSIDSVIESVAVVYKDKAIACILTGMGKDGANALMKVKQNGGLTIAQNQESSVVYGMPKEAYESGAASYQIDLKNFPAFIISAL
ncbi:MAG: chemotaxis protein CheB [Bacteroidota bacterium]